MPKEYLLFHSKDHIKKINEILSEHINSGLVNINILEIDYGPCNKYQGMIQYYENNNLIDQNFVSIIIDDDLLYRKFFIYELLEGHYKNNRSIISGYHMSSIKTNINGYKSLIIKGADGTLIPKYFYTTNFNPSLKELLNNCIKTNRDAIFDDDNLMSAFIFLKKMDKISVNKEFLKYNHKTSYTYNKYIKDKGLSSKGNKFGIKGKDISAVLKDFLNFYDYKKYSNVDFRQ